MRRRKNRRGRRRVPTPVQRPKGFDYGCLPSVMAVGPYAFPSHLSAASVDAVAYGFDRSEEVARDLPFVSLVAQDARHLANAFEEFGAWAEATDPDALEVTFVFRKKGGYLLLIAPEYSRLERRCLGFDRAHRTMTSSAMWVKPIDSVHPMLRDFRTYRSQIVAPFLFGGATYHGPRSVVSSPADAALSPLPGIPAFLKFEVTLVDEVDARPHSLAWHALELDRGQETRSTRPSRVFDLGDVKRNRVRALRHHFPVTLERMSQCSQLTPMVKELERQGARLWQIEQAVCNLVLSHDLVGQWHFRSLSSRKVDDVIVEALGSRHEVADGRALPQLSPDVIQTQLVADANKLLRNLKKAPSTKLDAVQETLQSVSALDAPSVVRPSLVQP